MHLPIENATCTNAQSRAELRIFMLTDFQNFLVTNFDHNMPYIYIGHGVVIRYLLSVLLSAD